MTALEYMMTLPAGDRALVRRRTLRLSGYKANVALENAITDPDAPALHEALREWWQTASCQVVVSRIDNEGPARIRELAILVCAESVAHLAQDERVTECRLVRLAWARGEATTGQRKAAMAASIDAGERYAGYPTRKADRDAAWAASSGSVVAAVKDVVWALSYDDADAWDKLHALAPALRELYPDPCALDFFSALSRYDAACEMARTAMSRFSAGPELQGKEGR